MRLKKKMRLEKTGSMEFVVLHVCFVDPVEVRIFPESEIVG